MVLKAFIILFKNSSDLGKTNALNINSKENILLRNYGKAVSVLTWKIRWNPRNRIKYVAFLTFYGITK